MGTKSITKMNFINIAKTDVDIRNFIEQKVNIRRNSDGFRVAFENIRDTYSDVRAEASACANTRPAVQVGYTGEQSEVFFRRFVRENLMIIIVAVSQ